jgi:uncharacterized repeat protein (TIGR01451 family)
MNTLPVAVNAARRTSLRRGGTNMARRTKFSHLCTGLLPILIGVLAVGGLLLAAQPASATNPAFDGCIQDVWAAHGNTQSLTCTANDVSVARVNNITIASGGSCTGGTCTCNAADPNNLPDCSANPNAPGCVTFTANYEILLTAQTRYDIGLYFGTDGDPNGNGALTGNCATFIITPEEETCATPPCDSSTTSKTPTIFTNLDASPDICGDIINNTKTTSLNNPQHLNLTLSVACVAGSDGKLKLPNCTSWRTSGQNETCTTPNDAYPGAPSKCNCQPGFEVDIFVETASITVGKSVAPTTEPETGGTVTYTVTVQNNSSQATYTIDTIEDTIYGDLANNATCGGTGFSSCSNNTCTTLKGTTVAAGGSTSCTFDAFVQGNSGTSLTDTVEVCGTDDFGHTGLCGHHDATVSFTDVFTEPTVTKTATAVGNCQLDATYSVTVANNSTIDPLTVDSVTDNKFGDITTAHAAGGGFEQVVSTTFGTTGQCDTVSQIAPQGNCSFSFVGRITSTSCNFTHTNTATANTHDDDGVPFTDSDDATVNVTVTFQ